MRVRCTRRIDRKDRDGIDTKNEPQVIDVGKGRGRDKEVGGGEGNEEGQAEEQAALKGIGAD